MSTTLKDIPVKDTQLFELLAGLSPPWVIDRIAIHKEDRCIDIWAAHPTGVSWRCPECTYAGPCRDHAAERSWRHLDCFNFQVHLHARIPRVACSKHGVRQVLVPWADPDSRFTRRFERFAFELLQTCTVTGCSVILGLTWDEARGIQQRLERRRAEKKGARSGRQAAEAEERPTGPGPVGRYSSA
jgi:transposase